MHWIDYFGHMGRLIAANLLPFLRYTAREPSIRACFVLRRRIVLDLMWTIRVFTFRLGHIHSTSQLPAIAKRSARMRACDCSWLSLCQCEDFWLKLHYRRHIAACCSGRTLYFRGWLSPKKFDLSLEVVGNRLSLSAVESLPFSCSDRWTGFRRFRSKLHLNLVRDYRKVHLATDAVS